MAKRSEYELAIRIAGEIDKSLKDSTNLTRKELNKIARATVKAGVEADGFRNKLLKVEPVLGGIEKAGKAAFKTITAAVSAGVIALGAISTASFNAGSNFETAFAGVKKTVEATESEYALMEKNLRAMAKDIPQTAVGLSGIAESAGQLGIAKKNITDFTRTMADMDVATDLSSDAAATEFAQFANITKMSQEHFSNLGSTVVALGNNLATTESSIVSMAMRVGAAGSQVGMSQAQIMGYSAALASVGIEAEAGGSSISKTMINMQLAVERGGESLSQYAKVAGMSAGEFAKAFRQDAAGALEEFILGIENTERNGKTAIAVLDDMGIKEVRQRDTLLRAAGAGEMFSRSLQIANMAWDENTALANEAAQRYKTVDSQVQIFQNRMTDAGITLYQDFRDPLVQGLQVLNTFSGEIVGGWAESNAVTEFAENVNKKLPTAIRKTKEFGEAVGDFAEPFLSVGGWILDHPGTITGAIAGLGTAIAGHKVVSGVESLVSSFKMLVGMGPVGWWAAGITGAVAAITGIATEIKKASNEAKKANLAKHFGDISLSLEDLDKVASHLVENQELAKVREALSAFDDLSDMQRGIDDAVEEINRMNWKVSIGMELSDIERETYQSEVASYIEQVQSFVQQDQYALTMAMSVLSDGDLENSNVVKQINDFYAGKQQELAELGGKLNDAITDAFQDGLLDMDEAKEIAELQQSMAKIQQALAGSEFEANLSLLGTEFSGQALDAESFENLQAKLKEYAQAASADYQEAYVKLVSKANIMRDEGAIDTAGYDEMVKEAESAYLRQTADIQAKSVEFQINTLKQAYGDELASAGPEIQKVISSKLNEIMTNDDFWNTYSTPEDWANGLNNVMLEALDASGLDASTKNALGELFENALPLMDEMEDLKSKCREAGTEIPESLLQGMNDLTMVGAASGDESALWTLIGNTISEDEEYSMLIEAARQAGGNIPEEVRASIAENQEGAVTEARNFLNTIQTTLENGVDAQIPIRYDMISSYSQTGEVPGYKNPEFQTMATYTYDKVLSYSMGGHAEGGIFNIPHVAWFAEDGPEAAIPINGTPEAVSLWEKTGELLGVMDPSGSFSSLAEGLPVPSGRLDGQDNVVGSSTAPNIIYSPNINFYGAAPDQNEMVEAMRISQEEFAAMMEQWVRENNRANFY